MGLANGRNPISIIVPCHRVVGSTGGPTGYGGGIDRKRALLALEDGRVPAQPGGLVQIVGRRIVTEFSAEGMGLQQPHRCRVRANAGKVGPPFDGATLCYSRRRAPSRVGRSRRWHTMQIDDMMVIVGSKAGADSNPDWVHNRAQIPRARIEVGTDAYDVVARELPRDATTVYPRIVAAARVRRIPGKDKPDYPAIRIPARLYPAEA